MDRKEEIIQSAVRFFSEKGYSSTSVQEIANDCGISKGTLYQLIDSKEDLLVQVIEYNHKKVLRQAMNVNLDPSLSAKERLIKKIVAQFEGIRNNKDFMNMLLRTLPPLDDPKIPMLMKKIKIKMTNWHKDCLLEAYGSKVESCIWDFTLMFQGVLREYVSLAIHDNKDIDAQTVARFVVEQFDTMINHTTDLEPILTSQEMKEYEKVEAGFEPESPETERDRLLEEVKRKIERSPMISDEDRKECLLAVQSLYKECHENEPRSFLVKALLLYLAENHELKDLTHHLEDTLRFVLQTK